MSAHGEHVSWPVDVELAGRLPFGQGSLGQDALPTASEQSEFARYIGDFVGPFTVFHTADCVEDRPAIGLADGTNDPNTLATRIAPQIPGGLGLGFTKVAVGANAAYLRDAKDFRQAYERTVEMLVGLGYEDAGHENCGASVAVEGSVHNEVSEEDIMATLPILTTVDEQTRYYLRSNWETKRQLLGEGFYSGWDPSWREDFLAERFPHNFSLLPKDSHKQPIEHKAEALVVIKKPGFGLAKTGLAQTTGRMAFAETPGIFVYLVNKLGGSQEERARMLLEGCVDPVQVLNGLAAETMPVFSVAV